MLSSFTCIVCFSSLTPTRLVIEHIPRCLANRCGRLVNALGKGAQVCCTLKVSLGHMHTGMKFDKAKLSRTLKFMITATCKMGTRRDLANTPFSPFLHTTLLRLSWRNSRQAVLSCPSLYSNSFCSRTAFSRQKFASWRLTQQWPHSPGKRTVFSPRSAHMHMLSRASTPTSRVTGREVNFKVLPWSSPTSGEVEVPVSTETSGRVEVPQSIVVFLIFFGRGRLSLFFPFPKAQAAEQVL